MAVRNNGDGIRPGGLRGDPSRRNRSGLRAVAAGGALAVSAVLLAGCSGGPRPLPAEITCTTQYRPDFGSSAGDEAGQLVLPRVDAAAATRQELVAGTFRLSGSYIGDAPDSRAVSLSVTDSDGTLLVSMLYQLKDGDSLENRFAGGHGFTGLHYVHSGGAELQLFCTADKRG